jgi:hypothetical protein
MKTVPGVMADVFHPTFLGFSSKEIFFKRQKKMGVTRKFFTEDTKALYTK